MKLFLPLSSLALSAAHASEEPAGVFVKENPSGEGVLVSRKQVKEHEKEKTKNPMYVLWAKALETRDNKVVNNIPTKNPKNNPENVQRAMRVFPEKEWNFLTGMANESYTYVRFLRAIGKFPAFCGTYTDKRSSDSDAICKKCIITAFAHFAQETGAHITKDNTSDNPDGLEEWQQALLHVREMGHTESSQGYRGGCKEKNWQTKKWKCAPGVGYFGRGAKQLSYHYNYGKFSEAMYGDSQVLLKNPEKVADSWLNLASAIWFFLTPQAPKPAMLHVIDRTWTPSDAEKDAGIGYGFGVTINIINGGIECGKHNKGKGQPVNRVKYWKGLRKYYDIPELSDEEDTCFQQKPYTQVTPKGETKTLYTNWELDWRYVADRPGGKSFECKLVHYETAYSALVKGDYERCVANLYGSHQGYPVVQLVDDF